MGSPLFDQISRIVGQLHGGAASCAVIDWDEYGKVDASWVGGGTAATRLSDWPDPLGTGALFVDGIDHQTCLFQPTESFTFLRETYSCTDTLNISLRDDNLRGLPSQDVGVSSTTEPDGETVTLTATSPGSGTFTGNFATGRGRPGGGDNQLSVTDGDVVTVSYLDADNGAGQSVTVTDTATIDCLGDG